MTWSMENIVTESVILECLDNLIETYYNPLVVDRKKQLARQVDVDMIKKRVDGKIKTFFTEDEINSIEQIFNSHEYMKYQTFMLELHQNLAKELLTVLEMLGDTDDKNKNKLQ